MGAAPSQSAVAGVRDPHEPVDALLRDLGSAGGGLPEQEARRRLETCGRTDLRRSGGVGWPRKLSRQLLHPLALLLSLAGVAGTDALVDYLSGLSAAPAPGRNRHDLPT